MRSSRFPSARGACAVETLKGGVGSLCSSLGGEGAPAVSPECAWLSWGGRQAVLSFEAGPGWLQQDQLLPPCWRVCGSAGRPLVPAGAQWAASNTHLSSWSLAGGVIVHVLPCGFLPEDTAVDGAAGSPAVRPQACALNKPQLLVQRVRPPDRPPEAEAPRACFLSGVHALCVFLSVRVPVCWSSPVCTPLRVSAVAQHSLQRHCRPGAQPDAGLPRGGQVRDESAIRRGAAWAQGSQPYKPRRAPTAPSLLSGRWAPAGGRPRHVSSFASAQTASSPNPG